MENIIINIIICFMGLLGLFYGGEKLVSGSVNTANNLRINPQLIAITIIALGTSFPELVVSVNAVLEKSPGIAWGNVVGSNISNILLVLGLASILTPLSFKKETLKINIFWLFFSTLILFLTTIFLKTISTVMGIIFLFILMISLSHFIFISQKIKKNDIKNISEIKNKYGVSHSIFLIFIGMILLVIAAEMVVYSSVNIAVIIGVPVTFIGLTVIAIGTSLPEIAASIVAVKKGHSDVAIGNIIGSNIFNCLGIIGTSAIFSFENKFIVPQTFVKFDIPIMLISTLLFCSLIYYKEKINRYYGVIFIVSYIFYILITLNNT